MGLNTHTCRANLHEDGLQDDCAACAEYAEAPYLELDHEMLRLLVERTLRNRFGGHYARHGVEVESPFGESASPRSNNEARAMAVVMTQLERVGKLAECAPASLALYLNERWRLETSIVNPRLTPIPGLGSLQRRTPPTRSATAATTRPSPAALPHRPPTRRKPPSTGRATAAAPRPSENVKTSRLMPA